MIILAAGLAAVCTHGSLLIGSMLRRGHCQVVTRGLGAQERRGLGNSLGLRCTAARVGHDELLAAVQIVPCDMGLNYEGVVKLVLVYVGEREAG